ncbi:EAL domain-containing protein [Rhodobacterales bacterium HKCCE3408]|nr:EAL domain-containing protein [Rhodobacterales bacterium HKCCE3408]
MSSMERIAAGLAGADGAPGALRAMRRHLGFDLAWLSELTPHRRVFRLVDAEGEQDLAVGGRGGPSAGTLCRAVATGDLPALVPDLLEFAVPLSDPIHRLPLRGLVAVPIRRPDGRLYGVFAGASIGPRPDLTARDLSIVQSFAAIAEADLAHRLERRRASSEAAARIEALLTTDAFHLVFQPIVGLRSGALIGHEALCRFDDRPEASPVKWFAEAREIDRGPELEMRVIAHALGHMADLPRGSYLSVNASPGCIAADGFEALFDTVDAQRVVLEVTDHMAVTGFDRIRPPLDALRAKGVRIAVDDAGAKLSGLHQIDRIAPEIVKLDRSLVDGIDMDRALRALVGAMVQFARESGAMLVAEGIERAEEAKTLAALGVDCGQGFQFGRPAPLQP